MIPTNWFDQGRALLDMPLPGGAAAAATSPFGAGMSPGLAVLLGLGSGARPALSSLSASGPAGALPQFGGGGDPTSDAPGNPDVGLSNGEVEAGLAAALSGAKQGLLGFSLNSLNANPTLSLANQGLNFSLNSGVPGRSYSLANALGTLGNLFGGPMFGLANALGGGIMSGLQGVSTRGGEMSGVNFGNGTSNPQAPGFFSGVNNSLSDAARGRGASGDDGDAAAAAAAAAAEANATAGMTGIGAVGNDGGNGPGAGNSGNGAAGVGGDSSSGSPSGVGGEASGSGPAGDGGGGGGGGGGDGGTVICTELRRQGLMDDATWRADEAFGRSIPRATIAGYQLWGRPLARLMVRSSLATRLVAPLALRWAAEMAHRMGVQPSGSPVGRLLMAVGIPFCTIVGRLITHPTPQFLHRS